MEYKVEACVSISGPVEVADVRATLKLEYEGSKVTYATLARCVCALLAYVLKCSEIFGRSIRFRIPESVRGV